MSEDGRSLRDGLSSLRDEAGKPSSPKASIPSALDFDIAFAAAAKPERELSLDWILLGVDRKGEPVVLDADSDFFDVDLLTEFWACDNGIEYPHDLAAGLYLMTDIAIIQDSAGDPTFRGKFTPLATVAQAIEARRAATGTGAVHESAVAASDAPNPEPPAQPLRVA